MTFIMQRRGVMLSMDLAQREERERQRERIGDSESGGGIKNGVLGLIMHTGQPWWSVALGSDIWSWGKRR